jgi:hypothetical protein
MSQGLNRHPHENTDDVPLPGAPLFSTVALPGQLELEEGGEDSSNRKSDSKSDLRGGLTGTLDGDPKAILLDCLDDIFPELFTFTIEN